MSNTYYLLLSRHDETGETRLRLGTGKHVDSTQPARVFAGFDEAFEGLRHAAPFEDREGKKWVPAIVEVLERA